MKYGLWVIALTDIQYIGTGFGVGLGFRLEQNLRSQLISFVEVRDRNPPLTLFRASGDIKHIT